MVVTPCQPSPLSLQSRGDCGKSTPTVVALGNADRAPRAVSADGLRSSRPRVPEGSHTISRMESHRKSVTCTIPSTGEGGDPSGPQDSKAIGMYILPGSAVCRPAYCKWCGSNIIWKFSRSHTTCPSCRLSWAMVPRMVADPVCVVNTPEVSTASRSVSPQQPMCVMTMNILTSIRRHGPPLSPADFRWCAVRLFGPSRQLVVIIRFDAVLAVMSVRLARWMRAQLLQEWYKRMPTIDAFNESDVAAHIVDWIVSDPGGLSWSPVFPTGQPFVGHDHAFADIDIPVDPGRFRPAALTAAASGNLYTWDYATSAHKKIAPHSHSPLRPDAIHTYFNRHYYGQYLHTSSLVGFPLMARTPHCGRRGRDSLRTSTKEFQAAVVKAMDIEIAEGACVPLPKSAPHSLARVATVFAVPKPDGRVRGVTDLTAGQDSVNLTTVRSSFTRLRLAKIDRILERIQWMASACPGRRIFLAKLDVTRAFRQFPIPTRDLMKAVHRMGDKLFANTSLMMGAAASGDLMSPLISAVRDHIALEYGWFSESYIDDFMMVVYADEAKTAVDTVLRIWADLGIPCNITKLETEGSPSDVCVFLGLLVSTRDMTVSVSLERVAKLLDLIDDILDDESLSGRHTPGKLASLAGKLAFVSAVIPMGRCFLRPIYLAGSRSPTAWTSRFLAIPIQDSDASELRDVILWWKKVLSSAPPTVSFASPPLDVPRLHVYTDASGIGFGGIAPCVQEYFAGQWSRAERKYSTTAIWEGAAIIYAMMCWAHYVTGGYLVVHCDNSACVLAFTKCYARHPKLAWLLRLAVSLQIRERVVLMLRHIPGEINRAADRLSRAGSPYPQAAHFRRVRVAHSTQALGGIMSSRLSRPTNTASQPTQPLSITSLDIASMSDTSFLHASGTIRWKSNRQKALQTGGCSISQDGWCPTALSPIREPYLDTYPQSGDISSWSVGGNLDIPLCCLSIASELVSNSLTSHVFGTPPQRS